MIIVFYVGANRIRLFDFYYRFIGAYAIRPYGNYAHKIIQELLWDSPHIGPLRIRFPPPVHFGLQVIDYFVLALKLPDFDLRQFGHFQRGLFMLLPVLAG